MKNELFYVLSYKTAGSDNFNFNVKTLITLVTLIIFVYLNIAKLLRQNLLA